MKRLKLTLTALASALLLAAPGVQTAARAQATATGNPAPDPQNVIVTSGEGLVTAAPDRAFVSISAESRAKLPKVAQQQNAQAMTAVQERLKAAGISGDAVRTITLDLQPEFDYNDGKQTLRGYVARNTIEARVDEIGKVGEVVDAAVASGATSVSNIRFDLKDRQAAQQKALAEAVADARAGGARWPRRPAWASIASCASRIRANRTCRCRARWPSSAWRPPMPRRRPSPPASSKSARASSSPSR